MRTSTINYRVADFLKQHPPFGFLDEAELLQLAGRGRVKMHERGERMFEEGGQPGSFVFVIQQGTVRLVNESGDDSQLRDILGPGDLLGVGRFLGHATHRHTALAASDVVLYCLQASDVEQLIATHGEVARYLGATASVRGPRSDAEETTGETSQRRRRSWVDETGLPDAITTRRLMTCSPDTVIQAAARQMATNRSDALVVVDDRGLPVGLLTTGELRDRVATAAVSPDAPVAAIMRPPPATARPGGRVGDYLLPMMRVGDDLVAVTADGTPDTPVEGLVTSRDLAVRRGTAPAGLASELRRAPSFADLAALHQRIRSLIVEQLTDTGAMDWLLPAVSELQRALVQRVVELATAECAADGIAPLDLDTCWLRFGNAGRQELLTTHDLDCGLVYADPPEAEAARVRARADALGRRVGAGLRAAGFVFSPRAWVVGIPEWCQPLSVWKERYAGWVRDPVRREIYRARALFDLRGIWAPPSALLDDLRRHIARELDGNDAFIAVLANDTLAHQPPLTFFHGLVVDEEETESAHLDIVRSAVQPLTDIGRVFALDQGAVEQTSTWERFNHAALHHRDQQTLLCEAAEAFRIALFHRACAGLAGGHDGSLVDPARLTKYEQTVLKSVFRTVVALLELTERRYLETRG